MAFQAGRILLERVHALPADGRDFAVETTLAGRAYLNWVRRLRASGYRFHLLFLSLPSEEMAVQRVAGRVRLGGQAISEATIRRRFRAGLQNFFQLYRPQADAWRLFDNSGPKPEPMEPQAINKLEVRWS